MCNMTANVYTRVIIIEGEPSAKVSIHDNIEMLRKRKEASEEKLVCVCVSTRARRCYKKKTLSVLKNPLNDFSIILQKEREGRRKDSRVI